MVFYLLIFLIMINKIKKLFFWNNYNIVQFSQTIILISILLVWINIFGLYLDIYKVVLVFASVIFFDLLLWYIFTGKTDGWFNLSKINIAFWILFFLRTDILWIYVFTAFVAVMSKYVFLWKGRHFLNPSNFWVSIALLLFPPYAYTNPLQWTFDVSSNIYWAGFLIVCFLGFFLIEYLLQKYLKFNQIPLIVSFILTHIVLFFSIGLHEWTWSAFTFFSITFLIFAFFMITDPKTTPKNTINKILFWMSVAVTYYVLSYFTNENFNLIWSLFLNTLFLPLIWYFEDNYKNYKKYLWALITLLFFSSLLLILFIKYGHLDLQFANRCISIVCKIQGQ